MGNRSRAISRRLLLGASGIGLAGLRCSSQQVPDRNTRVDRTAGINGVEAGVSRQQQPLVDASIGSAPELFVDRHLIASTKGVELRLHSPRRAEQALRFDLPWEGPASAYVTVFEDRNRYRMYYRGWPSTDLPDQTCYAESEDGVRWRKSELGLFDLQGSMRNNIVWRGVGTHNFTPFKDTRPDVPGEELYKAAGRGLQDKNVLHAFVSADGFRWRSASPGPVFTEGMFDSQNLAFWDVTSGKYRCYFRTPYRGVRGIGVVESDDFRRWTNPRLISLEPSTPEHLYTNATLPYFRNPRFYFAFPKRFKPTGICI